MGKRWTSGLNIAIGVVMMIVGVSVAKPASAQDPLTQTYTTSDGRLTVSYPETWGATELFGVLLSNDTGLLENLDLQELPAGVFIMAIDAGPIGEVLSLDSAARFDDVLDAAQAQAEGIFTDFVGPKIQEFNGLPAYRTIGHVDGQDGIYLYVDIGDGNVLFTAVFANEGELPPFASTIEAVVGSTQYHPPATPVVAGAVVWQQMELFNYEDFAPIGAVAVGPDDTIYVSGYYSGINVYDADGRFQETIGDVDLNNHWSGYAQDMAVAPDGTLWVVDSDQHVTHIQANGTILNSWGELGQDSGEFGEYSPSQVEVMADGRVITQDKQDTEDFYTMTRIQVWDEDGTLVQEFVPDPPGVDTTITGYSDIEMGPDGMLYIAGDYDLWRVDLESGDVSEVTLDASVLNDGYIQHFGIGADGRFVLASSSGTCLLFDAQGRYISQYGHEQASVDYDSDAPRFLEGEFYNPQGVGVLSNGQVVISDYNYTWWQVVAITFEQ